MFINNWFTKKLKVIFLYKNHFFYQVQFQGDVVKTLLQTAINKPLVLPIYVTKNFEYGLNTVVPKEQVLLKHVSLKSYKNDTWASTEN